MEGTESVHLPFKFDCVEPHPPPKVSDKRLQRKLDLLYIRKRLLYLHYSFNISSAAFRKLAEQLSETNELLGSRRRVSCEYLRQEYRRRGSWEPLVWAAFEGTPEIKKNTHDVLKFLSFARMNAIALIEAADNDSARVGAIGKLVTVIEKEITLRQSLGELPRVTMEPAGKVDVNVNTERQLNFQATTEALRAYEFLFKRGVQARADQK